METIQKNTFSHSRLFGVLFSVALVLVGVGLVTVSQFTYPQLAEHKKHLIAPPPQIERFAFGYQEVIADLMWVRTIQDMDYCDSQIAENVCRNNSWLYLMIDAITNLSPKFRMPYAAGALGLSVLITDVDGATKIFDKGIVAYPNDWPMLYRAAYHYLSEVKDVGRAAELMNQAGRNGAPTWVFALAGRLFTDDGKRELAENLLQQMIREKQDPALIKRLQEKLNSTK